MFNVPPFKVIGPLPNELVALSVTVPPLMVEPPVYVLLALVIFSAGAVFHEHHVAGQATTAAERVIAAAIVYGQEAAWRYVREVRRMNLGETGSVLRKRPSSFSCQLS